MCYLDNRYLCCTSEICHCFGVIKWAGPLEVRSHFTTRRPHKYIIIVFHNNNYSFDIFKSDDLHRRINNNLILFWQ